ncbi:Ubiquitin carboxyl-terminal hydrolase isozyme L5 [Pseudocercospora fuligena]|uniref:Ubiquitin carboxyl-terminal hydrolase n=1 Tax=Pseudocercospora fuligena TaxID=685502 RepID=A0A8H6RI50_9PEZI|nr:Ubiquitin carboxyl-terminal hydrolase isozyme L5 [Pseudocercospora fuligena]
MPPKRGQKRKATAASNGGDDDDGDAPLAPPDRDTWPGWVEMESEPAFFNVMLKEMGVRGVQVQDVLDLQMLPMMPQPIHALIFLFRYKPQDEADNYTGSDQQHIWFANQVPSFACASVALLNIVNNIPGLTMGPELRNFKDFTKDMDPLTRGDAIDSFDFVRRIHNSFARESDLLNADLHLKNKFDTFKKKEAAAKGRATKAAKKAAKEGALSETSPNIATKPERSSGRNKKPAAKAPETPSSKVSTPKSGPTYSVDSSPEPDGEADDFKPGSRKKPKGKAEDAPDATAPTRRSARTPKPRDTNVYKSEAEEPEEGFHFIAYMPIGDHVWKLDGLDYYPHDMGTFGVGGNGSDGGTGDWLHVVAPTIENRMAQYAGADIEFNIMAVVHDPVGGSRNDLLKNVKNLQAIDKRLDVVFEDWRALDGAETTKDTITGISLDFEIMQPDVDAVDLSIEEEKRIAGEDDFMELIKMRQSVIANQAELRGALRMSDTAGNDDEEKARHRRHDYGRFVKGWLGALADEKLLGDLVDG